MGIFAFDSDKRQKFAHLQFIQKNTFSKKKFLKINLANVFGTFIFFHVRFAI